MLWPSARLQSPSSALSLGTIRPYQTQYLTDSLRFPCNFLVFSRFVLVRCTGGGIVRVTLRSARRMCDAGLVLSPLVGDHITEESGWREERRCSGA